MKILEEIFTYQNIHLIVGAIVVILLAYFKFKKLKFLIDLSNGFFKWVKPSFEDTNGDASSRRLTAFAVVLTYVACRVSYAKHVTDDYYLLAALVVDALFILLLFGIVTFQQIMSLKDIKGLKNNKNTKSLSSEDENIEEK